MPKGRISAVVLWKRQSRPTAIDVARWGTTAPVVFFLYQTRREIQVSIGEIESIAVARALGSAPDREQPPYVDRYLAIATFSGKRPDLFVIDRNRRSGTVRLSVFSGESQFDRALIRSRTLPIADIDPASWVLDVARGSSAHADILFIRRSAGSLTGTTEVHVLTGASDYKSFALHSRVSRKASNAHVFAIGTSRSGRSIYSIGFDASVATLRITPLTSPRTSPSC
jgi:hypothetical protein